MLLTHTKKVQTKTQLVSSLLVIVCLAQCVTRVRRLVGHLRVRRADWSRFILVSNWRWSPRRENESRLLDKSRPVPCDVCSFRTCCRQADDTRRCIERCLLSEGPSRNGTAPRSEWLRTSQKTSRSTPLLVRQWALIKGNNATDLYRPSDIDSRLFAACHVPTGPSACVRAGAGACVIRSFNRQHLSTSANASCLIEQLVYGL